MRAIGNNANTFLNIGARKRTFVWSASAGPVEAVRSAKALGVTGTSSSSLANPGQSRGMARNKRLCAAEHNAEFFLITGRGLSPDGCGYVSCRDR